MASDILVSHIQIPHYSEKNGFNDHLFEDKILDIEEEPQYENCEILRNILNNSLHNEKDKKKKKFLPKFEPRTSIGIKNLVSPKKIKKENIYENVNFINKYSNVSLVGDAISNSSSTPQINDEETIPKNFYRSTLSFVIGKPSITNNIDSQSLEKVKSPNSMVKIEINNVATNSIDKPAIDIATVHEESDDGSFKSSYAKSLMDSFHRNSNSPSQISPSSDLSSISSPMSNLEDSLKPVHIESLNSNLFFTENHTIVKNQHISKILNAKQHPYTEIKSVNYSPETVEQLEKKINLLTDNICNKDKELEKLKQDLISLRLEFNHVKAENRSLKVSQNISHRNSPSGLIGESQPSSLTSISASSDTWTLQQQVMSLNVQLEKAELSRHAYEAASRQLVHFLQTINTTLTTVAGKDLQSNEIDPSYFSPSTTTDILNHLENTLSSRRFSKLDAARRSESPIVKPHWYDKNREGSFISDSSIDPSYVNTTLGNSDTHHEQPELRCSSNSGHKYAKKERQEKVLRKRISKAKEEEAFADISKTETSLHQRTHSIPGRIFHGAKKSLVRSESVNDIPTKQVSHIPRVSRAMSTHCVNKIDISDCKDQNTNNSTHRLVSAKAKGFFSSLRSLFKNDNEKFPTDTSGPPSRKKMTLPLKYRLSKAKYDIQVQNLLTALPSHYIGASNLQNKNVAIYNDVRVPSSDISFESEKSLQNSIFYVPCYPIDTTFEDNEIIDLTLDGNDNDTTVNNADVDTSREELEVTQPTITARCVKPLNQSLIDSNRIVQNNSSCKNFNDVTKDSLSSDVEFSGPQEISVTLSFHQDNIDNGPGTYKCSTITGDGYCTSGSTSQHGDNKVTSHSTKPGGGLNCFNKINNKLSPSKKNKTPSSPIRETFNNSLNNCRHAHNFPAVNARGFNIETNCSKKAVKFLDAASINIHVNCGICTNNKNNSILKETCLQGTIACDKNEVIPVRRPFKFNSKCLKQALWKLSRSSYRDPGCRIEFV